MFNHLVKITVTLTCLAWLIITSPAHAKAIFKGSLVLNQHDGNAMAGVVVIADGASQTISDSNGQFMLVFPNKKPGDLVQIRINKADWVIINAIVLNQRPLPQANALPFTLILAKREQQQLWAKQYFNIKSQYAVEQSYQLKLAKLTGSNNANKAERDRLISERNQAQQQATELAKQLAELSVTDDNNNSIYHQVIAAFMQGKVNQALTLLDEAKLAEQVAKQKQQQHKEQLQLINAYALKAKILAIRFDFDGAQASYKTATQHYPYSFDAWLNYAIFLQQQNQFSLAASAYQQALTLICRKAKTNPAVNLPDVAMTLNNLGLLHNTENRMTAALSAYDEALSIRRKLAKTNPAVYLPKVAMTLFNFALLHYQQGQFAPAIVKMEQALAIYQQFAAIAPNRYTADVKDAENALRIIKNEQQSAKLK